MMSKGSSRPRLYKRVERSTSLICTLWKEREIKCWKRYLALLTRQSPLIWSGPNKPPFKEILPSTYYSKKAHTKPNWPIALSESQTKKSNNPQPNSKKKTKSQISSLKITKSQPIIPKKSSQSLRSTLPKCPTHLTNKRCKANNRVSSRKKVTFHSFLVLKDRS